MLSGRENYNRAIEFKSPEYLPCKIYVDLNWIIEKDDIKVNTIKALQTQFPDDMIADFDVAKNIQEPVLTNGVNQWVDEWGTGWSDDGHGAKTDSYPLSKGYESINEYKFPDPELSRRFDLADELLKQRNERYVRPSVWFTLFERLWMLRNFENILMDPYIDMKNFCYLRDKIVEYNLAIIDKWLERDVDSIFFSDDWGSQQELLIRPEDWRKYYKSSYKKMFDRVRSKGKHVWMHLCGNITAILPDLIDIGLNVLNPVQPQAMDVNYLAKQFGGQVCFNGGVDVQGTLINGSQDDVKQEVHNLVDLFGKYNGGYICGTSHSVMPETPLDNVIAMYEAFLQYQRGK